MRKLSTLAVGMALAGISAVALAAPIPFSGSWSPGSLSGTLAPDGLPWVANAFGTNSWGVPGVGNATLTWPGPDGYRDFHVSFDLPDGVVIDNQDLGTDCTGGASGGTVFCVGVGADFNLTPWEVEFDGPNSISFYAPAGQSLDAGDAFFVNIFFTGAAASGSFTGSWTDTGRVPEPLSVALFGIGLAALGFSRRRNAAGS